MASIFLLLGRMFQLALNEQEDLWRPVEHDIIEAGSRDVRTDDGPDRAAGDSKMGAPEDNVLTLLKESLVHCRFPVRAGDDACGCMRSACVAVRSALYC